MLAVIYLIYNEGYSGRVDLGAEAIRLGRVLAALMPDKPEAHGLLALMMIGDSGCPRLISVFTCGNGRPGTLGTVAVSVIVMP